MAEKTTFAGIKPTGLAPRRPHLVAVVAFDGVVLADLAAPLEVFGRLRDDEGRRLYEVRICGQQPRIETEYAAIAPRWRLSSLQRAGTVIVPGIDDVNRPVPDVLLRALGAALKRRTRVASICSGAFVLARTGGLDGLKATTHWVAAAELARRHPAIEVDPNVLFVDNGRVLTSAGAAAGLDLCLHMIRRDWGARIAARAARLAVMPLERSGGQAQFIVHKPPEATESMEPLLSWMERNVYKRLSLALIARHAGMSTRTLSRRFREQAGATPAQWIVGARVRRAQMLLETTSLPVEEIATEAGFRSASVLREHFGEIVGTTPLAYRRAFGSIRRAGTAL